MDEDVTAMPDREEFLNFAELWAMDGLRMAQGPMALMQTSVDMTRAVEQLNEFRRAGVAATHTHLLVRAAARTLAANPDLHQIVAGRRRLRPRHVDISLSISGDSFLTPIVVLSDAHRKSVAEMVNELARRVPEAQEDFRKWQRALHRWGRLLPFGFLRRAYLRFIYANPHTRHRDVGALAITMVPADWGATTITLSSGTLIGGQIHSHVTVVDNQPAVRQIMYLTFSGDHCVWNARAAARLLSAIKEEFERGTL